MTKFLIPICLIILATLPGTPEAARGQKLISRDSPPCKRIVLYYHDIIFGGNDPVNATSYASANASGIGNFNFGQIVVFDDPMTKDQQLTSPPAARAQGMYIYNVKNAANCWFSFSILFNSTEYKGTINVVGNDIIPMKTRDFSVVGGTGDFFMTRGIVSIQTETVEALKYFRLRMDIKLYECY